MNKSTHTQIDEIDQFLEKQLIQLEIDNFNIPITIKGIESMEK